MWSGVTGFGRIGPLAPEQTTNGSRPNCFNIGPTMNHPELIAVPILMLADYALTILGEKKVNRRLPQPLHDAVLRIESSVA